MQDAVSAALQVPKGNVKCHVTLLGGGFGRKSKPGLLLRSGAAVTQIRQAGKGGVEQGEDLRYDYYHAPAAMHLKASTDAKGRPDGLLFRSAYPSIFNMFTVGADYGSAVETGMGPDDMFYAISNYRAESGAAKHHVRIGWLRSVAHIYHAFALHTFMDELAASAQRDRVEFQLDLLGKPRLVPINLVSGQPNWNNGMGMDKFPVDAGRLRRVLEVCAEKSGWAKV